MKFLIKNEFFLRTYMTFLAIHCLRIYVTTSKYNNDMQYTNNMKAFECPPTAGFLQLYHFQEYTAVGGYFAMCFV